MPTIPRWSGWNRLAAKTSSGTRERTPTCRGRQSRISDREHVHAKGALLMKAIGFMRMMSGVAVVSSIVFGGVPARADVLDQTKKAAGVTVHYKVVLPNGYDATKTYPAIIALGGGPQTMNTVNGILTRNFRLGPGECAFLDGARLHDVRLSHTFSGDLRRRTSGVLKAIP